MQELDGKNAFVTGGASGIGLAMAQSLASRGVGVALADIDFAAAQASAEQIRSKGGRACAVVCDVTDDQSMADAADSAAAELGEIRIVLNNAGGFATSAFEETRRQDWEWLIELNVMGVVAGLHTFLPRLRAQGGEAHIVNTASVSGHIAVPGLSIYTATKFAVVGLSECLRQELADTPIGVSVLCPGIVRTSLLETSERHRPERHRPERQGGGAEGGVDMQSIIEGGTDPAELGEKVVAGIEAGAFYIFSHPNVRPVFENRFAEILEAYES